jgi:exodeoxyribonuclease III
VKIATWNINGIKARIDNLVHWLADEAPDIVCLQETKCPDEAFPAEAVERLGYNAAHHGQKGFNGVAILAKQPLEEVCCGLAGDPGDSQARFIEAIVSVPGGAVRVACAYMPNGNPIGSDKFAYKLAWLARLQDWAADRLRLEEPLIIAGD